MNNADKKAAEEYQRKLQDNALEMYSSKEKSGIKKNHNKIEKIKNYLKKNGGE